MTEREELKPCKCGDDDDEHYHDECCGFMLVGCRRCDIEVIGGCWDETYALWNSRMEQEG